jgi:hypothetical protein
MSNYYEENRQEAGNAPESEVRTTIQTVLHRIDGRVSMATAERLQDTLNADAPFVTVTGATVFDSDGNDLYRSATIVVNRSHIIWAIPYEA